MYRPPIALLLLLTPFMAPTLASASDCGCESLLAQGVFARREKVDVKVMSAAEHQLFCESSAATARQITDQYFTLGIAVPDLGSLDLGKKFSDEQYSEWKKASCKQTDAASSSQSLSTAFSSFADPQLVTGFNECVSTCASGKGGLYCRLQDIDDSTSAFFISWRPRTNKELELPSVTSVRVGGGQLANDALLHQGSRIPVGGLLATVTRKSPSAVLAVEVNTDSEPCKVKSDPPVTEYTVRATLSASGVVPVVEQKSFSGDHNTSGDCGMNENRVDTFCLPNGATVTDVGQPSIRTQNCGTRVVSVNKNGSCVEVTVNLKGCGNPCQVSNPFGGCIVRECKGNGWIGYDIFVKGVRYEPGTTSPKEDVKAASIPVGETGSISFAYPREALGTAKDLTWHFIIEVQRRRGGRYLPTISFSEGSAPSTGDVTASVSSTGVLTVVLKNAEKKL